MSQLKIAPSLRLSIKHATLEAIIVTGNWIHIRIIVICSIIYIHVNLGFNQGIQFHPPWMQMCLNVHYTPSRGILSASLAGNCDYTLRDML